MKDHHQIEANRLYSQLASNPLIERHREILAVTECIKGTYYAYRELLSFFENKPEYTVELRGQPSMTLYKLIKHQEKTNSTYLNIHMYKNGKAIGNICDGWYEEMPEYIFNHLRTIF